MTPTQLRLIELATNQLTTLHGTLEEDASEATLQQIDNIKNTLYLITKIEQEKPQ